MTMKRGVSNEPAVWIPFAVGGMIAAMLAPVHLLIFGIAIPVGVLMAAKPPSISLMACSNLSLSGVPKRP